MEKKIRKKIRKGILNVFGCSFVALFCAVYSYWAIFEWHIGEVDIMAKTFRLMSIFVAIVLFCFAVLGVVLWSFSIKENRTKKKNLFQA